MKKIPLYVFNLIKRAGGVVSKLEGENLYSVTEIIYKDLAWYTYEVWSDTLDVYDPKIRAGCFPSEKTIKLGLHPPDSLFASIQREANSIIDKHRYSKIAPLIEYIRNPSLEYPTLASLQSGSYICTLNIEWANAGVEISVFK